MTREEALRHLQAVRLMLLGADNQPISDLYETLTIAIEVLENIVALGENMRICREAITDEKMLIGFNMAVAICNKYLGESEE